MGASRHQAMDEDRARYGASANTPRPPGSDSRKSYVCCPRRFCRGVMHARKACSRSFLRSANARSSAAAARSARNRSPAGPSRRKAASSARRRRRIRFRPRPLAERPSSTRETRTAGRCTGGPAFCRTRPLRRTASAHRDAASKSEEFARFLRVTSATAGPHDWGCERARRARPRSRPTGACDLWRGGAKHLDAAWRFHALAEAVPALSDELARLIRAFHDRSRFRRKYGKSRGCSAGP